MTNYDVNLSLLSPLHIGNGEELRADFDFITSGGNTYRLNEDAILEDFSNNFIADRYGKYPLPGKVLRQSNGLDNPKYFRYKLRGSPRSKRSDARMKACIKDVYDMPYLPGSSLKGALRTALAWTGWSESNMQFNRNSLGRRKEWAGQRLERDIFGRNPNYDLLRALQVSDCFAKNAQNHLVVTNAQVLTKGNAGTPIELEAVAGDVTFSGPIKIDDFLFSNQAESKLHFSNHKHWLDELLARVQKHSHARIEAMMTWFNSVENATRVENFLHKLSGFKPKKNQALIQIGWGTGWDGKTFWTHLQQDEYMFEKIVSDYRMVRKGNREPGDQFPKSRRVVMNVKDGVATPLAPFGWALITMKECS